MLAHAAQARADPEEGRGGGVDEGENRLAFERADEFAQLGAGELQEWGQGRGAAAEALEDGEGGEQAGGGRAGQVELYLHGNRIAGSGGGEIGRKENAKHPPKSLAGMARRERKFLWE